MQTKKSNKWVRRAVYTLVAAGAGALAWYTIGGHEPPGQPDNPAWETALIWPGKPLGESTVPTKETRTRQDLKWRQITVLKDVTAPAVTIIRPPAGQANGAAMIVLPGGAFGVLAWDVEGTEVGQYLAKRGITAFVLKYRVRTPKLRSVQAIGAQKWFDSVRTAAAADAMQAVRFVRGNAQRYGIEPNRVGMIGFSAGAITMLRVLQDADASARPNIAASVYGLLFDQKVRPKSTPMFIAVAQDDPSVKHAETIHARWQQAGAPSELHIFKSGGHGFGLGCAGTESVKFPRLFELWLRKQGFLTAGG